jgi:hypothetical protein
VYHERERRCVAKQGAQRGVKDISAVGDTQVETGSNGEAHQRRLVELGAEHKDGCVRHR